MKFNIKLVLNANEINEANQKNAHGENVEVPKEIFKQSTLLVDADKITLAHLDSNGNIAFEYMGKSLIADYDSETWLYLQNTRFA